MSIRTGTIEVNGVQVSATVDRDFNLYPPGQAGRTAFKNAVQAKQFPVTITSGPRAGEVIPAVVVTVPCSAVSEQGSGNTSEVRTFSLSVATAGSYALTITFKTPEGAVSGIVRVGDGNAQTVAFTASAAYTTQVVTAQLTAGTNTIKLSSGPQGGYIAFKQVCAAASN